MLKEGPMQNITTIAELKNAIQFLEVDRAEKKQILKTQFNLTYESLKPANLIKKTFKDIVTAPNIVENTLGVVMGLATGYLTKKIVIGASSNIFRKILGSIMQLGVTNAVSQNSNEIASSGKQLFQRFFNKKKKLKNSD